ncbi:MAG: hypothetical protein ACXVRP_11150, partial [Solirubrobacteraceae bacterium]
MIYVSGFTREAALHEGMPPGDGFLAKPYRAEDLRRVLDRVFATAGDELELGERRPVANRRARDRRRTDARATDGKPTRGRPVANRRAGHRFPKRRLWDKTRR